METLISFSSGELVLEGLLDSKPGKYGVVVTHPHPLYGGDMYNPVVEAMGAAYSRAEFTTLRFNFRGVGNSGGNFDNGIAEQQDVLAALQFVLSCGISVVHLAGYSFGARVLAGMSDLPEEVVRQVHVAPPVAFMDYSTVTDIVGLTAVLAGSADDIAPPTGIERLLGKWNANADLIIIDGADHMFSGCLGQLEKRVEQVLR